MVFLYDLRVIQKGLVILLGYFQTVDGAFHISDIKPGATPGVHALGDISYYPRSCLVASGKMFAFEVSLQSSGVEPSSVSSRKLLTLSRHKRSKDTKIRPPAWLPPHMSKEDIRKVNKLVEYFSSSSNYCPFLIKNCIVPGKEYVSFGKEGLTHSNFSGADVSQMIDVPEGSWGNCALVGLADTMLKHKSGSEIDDHDVVIRLGELPLRQYKGYVGMKTDATWVRRRGKMASRGTISKEREKVRWYIGHNNGNVLMPTLKLFGKQIQTNSSTENILGFAKQIYQIFRTQNWNKGKKGKKKDRSPSTGFVAAIDLIFSKLCKRIDLYGFSSNCGGAYHDTHHLMQVLHNCELESWVLHHIMKEYPDLGVCVHT